MTQSIMILTDADIPEELRLENLYREMNRGNMEICQRFRDWCQANGVYYYSRPDELYREQDAFRLARDAGCSKLILENLS